MSDSASQSLLVATRYATAAFELAKDQNELESIEIDTDKIGSLLIEATDFVAFLNSPLTNRRQQMGVVANVSRVLNLTRIFNNLLGLMASKGRLSVMSFLIDELKRLLAEEKGEVTAEITSSHKLTDKQKNKLKDILSSSTGKTIKLNSSVDETILGGLIVKVESRMLDTSIKAKLDSLQANMKEVG
jgi:F-type H+-transporting ATPase subunit delta